MASRGEVADCKQLNSPFSPFLCKHELTLTPKSITICSKTIPVVFWIPLVSICFEVSEAI